MQHTKYQSESHHRSDKHRSVSGLHSSAPVLSAGKKPRERQLCRLVGVCSECSQTAWGYVITILQTLVGREMKKARGKLAIATS